MDFELMLYNVQFLYTFYAQSKIRDLIKELYNKKGCFYYSYCMCRKEEALSIENENKQAF